MQGPKPQTSKCDRVSCSLACHVWPCLDSAYTFEWWGFEAVELLRKAFILGFANVLSPGSTQVALNLLWSAVFISIYSHVKPYSSWQTAVLQHFSQVTILLTLLAELILLGQGTSIEGLLQDLVSSCEANGLSNITCASSNGPVRTIVFILQSDFLGVLLTVLTLVGILLLFPLAFLEKPDLRHWLEKFVDALRTLVYMYMHEPSQFGDCRYVASAEEHEEDNESARKIREHATKEEDIHRKLQRTIFSDWGVAADATTKCVAHQRLKKALVVVDYLTQIQTTPNGWKLAEILHRFENDEIANMKMLTLSREREQFIQIENDPYKPSTCIAWERVVDVFCSADDETFCNGLHVGAHQSILTWIESIREWQSKAVKDMEELAPHLRELLLIRLRLSLEQRLLQQGVPWTIALPALAAKGELQPHDLLLLQQEQQEQVASADTSLELLGEKVDQMELERLRALYHAEMAFTVQATSRFARLWDYSRPLCCADAHVPLSSLHLKLMQVVATCVANSFRKFSACLSSAKSGMESLALCLCYQGCHGGTQRKQSSHGQNLIRSHLPVVADRNWAELGVILESIEKKRLLEGARREFKDGLFFHGVDIIWPHLESTAVQRACLEVIISSEMRRLLTVYRKDGWILEPVERLAGQSDSKFHSAPSLRSPRQAPTLSGPYLTDGDLSRVLQWLDYGCKTYVQPALNEADVPLLYQLLSSVEVGSDSDSHRSVAMGCLLLLRDYVLRRLRVQIAPVLKDQYGISWMKEVEPSFTYQDHKQPANRNALEGQLRRLIAHDARFREKLDEWESLNGIGLTRSNMATFVRAAEDALNEFMQDVIDASLAVTSSAEARSNCRGRTIDLHHMPPLTLQAHELMAKWAIPLAERKDPQASSCAWATNAEGLEALKVLDAELLQKAIHPLSPEAKVRPNDVEGRQNDFKALLFSTKKTINSVTDGSASGHDDSASSRSGVTSARDACTTPPRLRSTSASSLQNGFTTPSSLHDRSRLSQDYDQPSSQTSRAMNAWCLSQLRVQLEIRMRRLGIDWDTELHDVVQELMRPKWVASSAWASEDVVQSTIGVCERAHTAQQLLERSVQDRNFDVLREMLLHRIQLKLDAQIDAKLLECSTRHSLQLDSNQQECKRDAVKIVFALSEQLSTWANIDYVLDVSRDLEVLLADIEVSPTSLAVKPKQPKLAAGSGPTTSSMQQESITAALVALHSELNKALIGQLRRRYLVTCEKRGLRWDAQLEPILYATDNRQLLTMLTGTSNREQFVNFDQFLHQLIQPTPTGEVSSASISAATCANASRCLQLSKLLLTMSGCVLSEFGLTWRDAEELLRLPSVEELLRRQNPDQLTRVLDNCITKRVRHVEEATRKSTPALTNLLRALEDAVGQDQLFMLRMRTLLDAPNRSAVLECGLDWEIVQRLLQCSPDKLNWHDIAVQAVRGEEGAAAVLERLLRESDWRGDVQAMLDGMQKRVIDRPAGFDDAAAREDMAELLVTVIGTLDHESMAMCCQSVAAVFDFLNVDESHHDICLLTTQVRQAAGSALRARFEQFWNLSHTGNDWDAAIAPYLESASTTLARLGQLYACSDFGAFSEQLSDVD